MNKDLFYTLLDNMSVTGYEIELQKKLIEHMTPHCDKIITDYTGNVICAINPDAPFKVMLAGHIDEIGLVVTNIQGNGYIRVTRAGGARPYCYPGNQMVIYGENGPIYGTVVCNEAVSKEPKVSDIAIDIGAKDAEEAGKYVAVGDPVHVRTFRTELLGNLLCSRAIDDKGGVFIVMEALKRARERGCKIGVYAAATVGEEGTGRGAHWAGLGIDPNVAIAVDVTFAQDYPGGDPNSSGDIKLGAGPVICHSSLANKKINKLLMTCAKYKEIPYQAETFPGRTSTDADTLHLTCNGISTALLSLPLRYMHTPTEVCSLDDVENSINLLAEFLCRIDENTDIDPFK